jgi:hypothetical protein
MTLSTKRTVSELRDDCALASKLWSRTFSALTAMTFREKGEDALTRLWIGFLRREQIARYRDGLLKLGIADDEPPAVAAAKYHYFTNQIAGLDMEYVEESPRKVWIRYLAPMWTYAGVAMMAMPSGVRRVSSSGWHARNGIMMGCPRLGYVKTKVIMEGEPYDEGYFMEYDHDLGPDELFRHETVLRTPECDRTKLPTLDPIQWPEERKLKSRRNFCGDYVRVTIETLYNMFGTAATLYVVEQTLRCVAIQYTHELVQDVGLEDRQGASAVSFFFSRLLQACGQTFESKRLSPTKQRILLRSFKPFGPDAVESLRVAFFAFQQMSARLIGRGRVSVARRMENDIEIWEIEDMGRWLW